MNDLEHITFSPSYFVDEVREGFYVSGMMKRYWAAQLSVLGEIDKVCKKHGLRWWADNGTLLGAVRHAGYIPWDDDIDIVMMRDDLERFLAVAKDELPEDYALLNVRISDYEYLITQVTNGFVIGLEDEALMRNRGCPYITGVDIFVLDGIFPDEKEDEARNAFVRDVDRAAAYVKEGQQDSDACIALLNKIEKEQHLHLPRGKRLYHTLLKREEDLFASCEVKDAQDVAQMIFWPVHGNHRYRKSWYDDTVYLPFEHTYLPVPAHYDEVLRTEYGDYMRLVKGGSSHVYPVYSNQEELLAKKTGAHPGRYTFSPADLQAEHVAKRKEKMAQMTALLTKVDAQVSALSAAGDTENATKLLTGIAPVVDALEALTREHTEIVFLAVRADWWEGDFAKAVRAARARDNTRVIVIAVPYAERNEDFTWGDLQSDLALFPAEAEAVSPDRYMMGARQPDVIVTQFPFDGTHDALTIAPAFHTTALRKMTDRLIYLPYLSPEEPSSDNAVAFDALKVMAEQPATVFADETYLHGEATASLFIETMTGIAGKDTRSVWEEKIKDLGNGIPEVMSAKEETDGREDASAQKEKKHLLFFVSVAFLMEHKEEAVHKVRGVLEIFSEHAGKLKVIWVKQKEDDVFEKAMPSLCQQYRDLQETFRTEKLGEIAEVWDEAMQKEADAYYGCGGVIAHAMRNAHKPVMIMGV